MDLKEMNYPIRINKYLREKQYASRKEADRFIDEGIVWINGKRAEKGQMVKEGDKVLVKNRKQRVYEYHAYYKPRGLPTQGEKGQESVVTKWAVKGLFPIGRLDKESEGLIILTNDGRLSTKILGPQSGFEKEYMVMVNEKLRPGVAGIFIKGMNTESLGQLLPAQAKILNEHKINIILHEGKKHQIRIMLSDLGYTVRQLKRVRVGPVKLGKMTPGQIRPLTTVEQEKIFS